MLGRRVLHLVLMTQLIFAIADETPSVTIENGQIEGHILKSARGRDIAAFEGIPYAEPPIHDLRFEPPQPKAPWMGTRKATKTYYCLQYMQSHPPSVIGTEDCLYLNVYKPMENAKNLDVIVYIHGGAFMFHSGGAHRPDYIVDKHIILVTLNYRLGPLGFLSTEDEVLPGNNGLKDQNMALQWVKQNIHHFGGNSNSITIVGMSAGGASVHYHTLSPLSKGLFNKAFAQSGVSTNPWAFTDNSRQKAYKLGHLLGCPTSNSQELLQCLKIRPDTQIVQNVEHFQVWLYNPFTPFGPVVDKWSENPFLPEHPVIIMKNKKMADVPMIFSFAACEGLYPAADFTNYPEYAEDINQKWNELMPYILDYNDTLPKNLHDEVSQKIRETYFGDSDVTAETFQKLVDMLSDRIFLREISDVAQTYSSSMSSPVYVYKFSYLGEHSLPEIRGNENKFDCASHADDTLYVLSIIKNMRSTEADAKISDVLIDIWVSFAKTGHPKVESVIWPPLPKIKRKTIDYLHIYSPEKLKYESFKDLGNNDFWSTIPFEENENLFVENEKDEL